LSGSAAVRRDGAFWHMSLYASAGEGGGCFVPSAARRPGGGGDPERSAAEAARRATGRLRRYCAHNRLDRLVTLTYRGQGCHDPKVVRAHLAVFFRQLRAALDGEAFPYVWVPELHKTGHGFHVHCAVGRFIRKGRLDESWPHGFTHIKRLDGVPGLDRWARSRIAARYLSKYVTKSFTDVAARPKGLHRFDVAQGFTPRPEMLTANSREAVIRQAAERMGGEPSSVWLSDGQPGWQGAPSFSARWGAL
jgi:hypothetical protein